MRREWICFTFQEAWTLDHMCGINKEKYLLKPSDEKDKDINENGTLTHEEQG